MARLLPALADNFAFEVAKAEELVSRLEMANITLATSLGRNHQIGLTSLELSYELAFLRVFLAWEIFLEEVFLRLLCGYAPRGGVREPLQPGVSYCRTITDAELVVLGGQHYKLWHNPLHIVGRARSFFQGGHFELVIASNQASLHDFARIRHRVAHAQKHAKREFDVVTMSMASRRYPASRPGRFLRDWRRHVVPPARHFSAITSDLLGLARQICP